MNCVMNNTTAYVNVLIISVIILVLVILLIDSLKNNANCRVRKNLKTQSRNTLIQQLKLTA